MLKENKVIGKMLPHSIEAEQCVIGCALIDENVPAGVLGSLTAKDFYIESHQIIFEAISDLYKKNDKIDLVTVSDMLSKKGLLESIGDIDYLAKLTNMLPSAFNYENYMEIVKRDSIMRKLIDASQQIATNAYSATSRQPLADAEKLILDIAEEGVSSSLQRASEKVDDVIKILEDIQKDKSKLRGVTTGFYGLDKITNGLQKGDLVLLAARPGFGKTSFAMNIVVNAAKAGHKCAIFSLEMSAEQLLQRMICSIAYVDMARALSGDLNSEEWCAINSARALIKDLDIYIDDNSGSNPLTIASKCRRLKHEKGLDLIMIDYLQLMTSPDAKAVENRQQEISNFTRTLKLTAKDLGVPILLLSQLNRAVEARKDHSPMLSDLRESGSIEQDADIVLFIKRPDQYEDTKTQSSRVELVIAKHRNGQQGSVPLIWKGEFTTFLSVNRDRNEESLERTAPPEHKKKPATRWNQEDEYAGETPMDSNINLDGIF